MYKITNIRYAPYNLDKVNVEEDVAFAEYLMEVNGIEIILKVPAEACLVGWDGAEAWLIKEYGFVFDAAGLWDVRFDE